MIRKLALVLGLLTTAPAFAADTITITMVSDGNYSGTLSKTITFTVADMNTFQNYLLTAFPCTAPCTNTVPLAATAWLSQQKALFVAGALSYQQQTAASAVTPIAPN